MGRVFAPRKPTVLPGCRDFFPLAMTPIMQAVRQWRRLAVALVPVLVLAASGSATAQTLGATPPPAPANPP